jgi:hypothetical protein
MHQANKSREPVSHETPSRQELEATGALVHLTDKTSRVPRAWGT